MSFHFKKPRDLSPNSFQNYFYKVKPRSQTPTPKSIANSNADKFFAQKRNSIFSLTPSNKTRNPSLMLDLETEESLYFNKSSTSSNQKNISNRDLNNLICENKNLNEDLLTIEKRLQRYENDVKMIKTKTEATSKLEKKIKEKRELSLNKIKEKEIFEMQKKSIIDQKKSKNVLEKNLNKENISKNMNKIHQIKLQKVLNCKKEKEILSQRRIFEKEFSKTEKIVKVIDLQNLEKKNKNKATALNLKKKQNIQTEIVQNIRKEQKNYYNLQAKIDEMKQREEEILKEIEKSKEMQISTFRNVENLFFKEQKNSKNLKRYSDKSEFGWEESRTDIKVNSSILSVE